MVIKGIKNSDSTEFTRKSPLVSQVIISLGAHPVDDAGNFATQLKFENAFSSQHFGARTHTSTVGHI